MKDATELHRRGASKSHHLGHTQWYQSPTPPIQHLPGLRLWPTQTPCPKKLIFFKKGTASDSKDWSDLILKHSKHGYSWNVKTKLFTWADRLWLLLTTNKVSISMMTTSKETTPSFQGSEPVMAMPPAALLWRLARVAPSSLSGSDSVMLSSVARSKSNDLCTWAIPGTTGKWTTSLQSNAVTLGMGFGSCLRPRTWTTLSWRMSKVDESSKIALIVRIKSL